MTPGTDRASLRLARVGREFGHGFSLGLERIASVLAELGRPQDRLPPVIHVAGTNGKGSTCAFLRAIFEADGRSAHVFTSPHLVRVNERIRLAGRLVEDDAFIAAIDRVGATGLTVTYFEALTAAALWLFAEHPADVLILEVGLGGRHDATNVVQPAVSVIAPVDYDHKDFLGETLTLIAGEKAGILKPGVPGVIARQAPEAMAVIEAYAASIGAPLLRAGVEWDAWAERGRLIVQTQERLLDLPAPALPGAHQFENAGLAAAAALAHRCNLHDDVIAAGVSQAVWPARLQRLTQGPLAERAARAGAALWLDGGHNPHAGRALAAHFAGAAHQRPLALVVGMLKTKDLEAFLAPFLPLQPRLYATAVESSQAALAPEIVAARARALDLQAEAATLDDAVAGALAHGARTILICGSLYLAGAVLAQSGG